MVDIPGGLLDWLEDMCCVPICCCSSTCVENVLGIVLMLPELGFAKDWVTGTVGKLGYWFSEIY